MFTIRCTLYSMRGEGSELKYSVKIQDQQHIMLSSKLLRRYNCGQVDFCILYKNEIYIIEVKSSGMGVQASQYLQKSRLLRSAELISSILNLSSKIIYR